MKYNTPAVNRAAARLARLVERVKLADGSSQRRKAKRFQHIACSMARAYRVAKREMGHTKYNAAYKAKHVRDMLNRLYGLSRNP